MKYADSMITITPFIFRANFTIDNITTTMMMKCRPKKKKKTHVSNNSLKVSFKAKLVERPYLGKSRHCRKKESD